MRKLTQREKILLGAVGVVIVVVLIMTVEPFVRQILSGGDLSAKREQLEAANGLIQLHEMMKTADASLQARVGLQGRTISDALLNEISRQVDFDALNRARTTTDLARLHPALEPKGQTLFAYKKEHGQFENLETLKDIQGPIFEGEQPEAVISQRISELAQKAGLEPKYQLNIKQLPGKKAERISKYAVGNVIRYLYNAELEAESKQLQETLQQLEAEQAEQHTNTEQQMMDAMFEGWFDDADTESTEETAEDAPETEKANEAQADADTEAEQTAATKPEVSEPATPKRQFAAMPEAIPLSLRIQLIEFIRSNLKQEMMHTGEFQKGFLEDSIVTETVNKQGGFLGIGPKREVTQVKLKPGSALHEHFHEILDQHGQEQAVPEAESLPPIDKEAQLLALTTYIDEILRQKNALQNAFAHVPRTYQPETYVVEMKFSGEVDKILRYLNSIETASRWLQVKDVKISIADKQKPVLNTDLSLIARTF